MGVPSDYGIIAILILTCIALTVAILVLTHIIGPKRTGEIKDSVYESGVDPIADARQRFNVRFYLVAVLFLVFDVDILLLYPWAVVFPKMMNPPDASVAANATQVADMSSKLADAGFGPAFFLVGMGIFFVLLLIGFAYEWRKGIFQWN